MLWVIFTIWFIIAFACAALAEITGKDIFGFIFLISLLIIFYIPFFIQCLVFRKNRQKYLFFLCVLFSYVLRAKNSPKIKIKFEIFKKF